MHRSDLLWHEGSTAGYIQASMRRFRPQSYFGRQDIDAKLPNYEEPRELTENLSGLHLNFESRREFAPSFSFRAPHIVSRGRPA